MRHDKGLPTTIQKTLCLDGIQSQRISVELLLLKIPDEYAQAIEQQVEVMGVERNFEEVCHIVQDYFDPFPIDVGRAREQLVLLRQLPEERLTEFGRRIQTKARDCEFSSAAQRDERMKETLIAGLIDRDLRCRINEDRSFKSNGYHEILVFAGNIENVRRNERVSSENLLVEKVVASQLLYDGRKM